MAWEYCHACARKLLACLAQATGRASSDSVKGKVTTQTLEDNLKAWSGDHCVDPRLVPGVLFSSHKIEDEKPVDRGSRTDDP